MKEKSQRQKDKEKHELIFKYVKSLTPFHNPQADHYLQKLNSNTGTRKSSILLESKVYEVNVAATKAKKKVSFVDVEREVETKLFQKKKIEKETIMGSSVREGPVKKEKEDSPQKIQTDLVDLQKQVFLTFKIKSEAKIDINQGNIQSARNIPDRFDKQINPHINIPSPYAVQKVQRAKSCSTISNIGLQSTLGPKPHQSTPVYQSQQVSHSKQITSGNSLGLSRSQSAANHNPPPFSQLQSQLSNRSSIYSKHSHSLMVEIFRQKLQSKRTH